MASVVAALARARAAGADAAPERIAARRHVHFGSAAALADGSVWSWTEVKMSCDGDHVYATLRDLSAEASVEETLRAFLLTASHDLRTPVNGMSCAAQLLAACPCLAGDAEAAALLRTVRAACALMAATLDSAMELRQLTGAAAAPRRGCVDARAVLEEVLDTCRAGLARPFEVVGDESPPDAAAVPVALWGDAAAVRHTMINLATACAHYAGPAGRCSAQLSLAPAADEAAAPSFCAVALCVCFEAQRDAPLSAAELAAAFVVHEGDGAGLAMHAARRLARAAGGDVTIASERCSVVLRATLRLDAMPGGAVDCDALSELAQPPVVEDAAAADEAPQDALALTARMLEHLVRTSDEMFHTGSIGPCGDFRFQFVSPAVKRLFGYGDSDLLDGNPMAYTHPDDVPRCAEVFTAVLTSLAATGAAHGAVAVQRRFRAADGSYRTVRTMGCVTPTRWTLVCKDLSPQFGRDEALRRLLHCVSRRLRDPAAAVLAAAQLLLARVPQADAQLLHAMGASCRLLLCVLRNVLSTRAADELEPPLVDAPFDPCAAACDVIDVLHTLHGTALELDADDASLPSVVEGDRALFCHTLMNIAGNACKFEAGGGVRVRMRWDGGAAQLVVAVTDFGAGVSDEDAARLFQPYEAAPAAQGGGAGLGLYVARRAARRMGGDVVLERRAQPGDGTNFTLRLPVRLPAADSPCPSPATPPASAAWQCRRPVPVSDNNDPEAAPEGLRCLLVDDHALNLRVVSRLLLRAGFGSVDTAVDGADALRKLRAAFAAGAPPHCVLMDMCMPVMSGPEAAAAFREWELQRTENALAAPMRLPVVAFTANVLREQHAECIAAGMDAVATKPLQRADVEALLQRARAYAAQLDARGSCSRPAKRRSGTLAALV